MASHCFRADLPLTSINTTRAVAPLDTAEVKGLPDTYPFGA